MSDPWAEHYDHMVERLRQSVEWLGGDNVVELIFDYWPGVKELEPVTPEQLGEMLDKWAKEK